MANAQIDDTLLVAFADGELDEKTKREVEAAIAGDANVRDRVAMFRRSSDLLRNALSDVHYSEVPPQLRKTIDRMVFQSRFRTLTKWALPVAAAIVGFIIGSLNVPEYFGGVTATGQVERILSEVAEYHVVFAREKEHLVEVPASRKAEVEAWLGDRVDLAFKVPDLTSRQLNFEGGRMFVIKGHPVAQLMYTSLKGERIALCVGLLAGELSTPIQAVTENGLQLYGQARGRHVFVVVGPSDEPGLNSLATQLPDLLKRS